MTTKRKLFLLLLMVLFLCSILAMAGMWVDRADGQTPGATTTPVLPPDLDCPAYPGPYPGPIEPGCHYHYVAPIMSKVLPTPTPVLPPD